MGALLVLRVGNFLSSELNLYPEMFPVTITLKRLRQTFLTFLLAKAFCGKSYEKKASRLTILFSFALVYDVHVCCDFLFSLLKASMQMKKLAKRERDGGERGKEKARGFLTKSSQKNKRNQNTFYGFFWLKKLSKLPQPLMHSNFVTHKLRLLSAI